MKSIQTIIIVTMLSVSVWSCEKASVPVASVAIEPAEISLPYPGFDSVSLQWEMTEPLAMVDGEPTVFLHLLDAEGNVERTYDHPLPFLWEPGSSHSYDITLYQSALAPPLEAGNYRLAVGLYGPDGQRWALADVGSPIAEFEYEIGKIDAAGDPSQVPMFYFSPSWLPLEAGTDVQILGRRWLTDEGTIRIAEIPAVGSIWMSLRISEVTPSLEELTMKEGETQPGFILSNSCGGEEQAGYGYGVHRLTVSVSADEAGSLPEECEITIRPNFQIVELNTLARRSVGLEILSWATD